MQKVLAAFVAVFVLVALPTTAMGVGSDDPYYTVTVENGHGRVLARDRAAELSDIDVRVPAAAADTCWVRTGKITYHDLGADIWQVRETAAWRGPNGVVKVCEGRTAIWSRSWGLWDIAWAWCGWVDTSKDGGTGWQTYYSKGCFTSMIPFVGTYYPRIKMFIYASGDWRVSGAPH